MAIMADWERERELWVGAKKYALMRACNELDENLTAQTAIDLRFDDTPCSIAMHLGTCGADYT